MATYFFTSFSDRLPINIDSKETNISYMFLESDNELSFMATHIKNSEGRFVFRLLEY